jgi:hypothetical protein
MGVSGVSVHTAGLPREGAIKQSESYPQANAQAEEGKDQHENWGHDAAPRTS